MLRLKVQKRWYDLLLSGEKKIEGRLSTVLSRLENTGSMILRDKPVSLIEFTAIDEKGSEIKDHSFIATVTKIEKFATIREMIETCGLSNILPGITNVDDGIAIYRQFYSEDVEKLHGALALHVELLLIQ